MDRRFALWELAKHREPALLVLGQTISGFGDGVANVALTLLVLDTTHSVSKLAWFAAARLTPQVVFLLVGGAIVDRFSRRLLMLLSDSMRAILTAGLVALIGLGVLHFWEMLVYAVLFGAFDAVFMPAASALIPEIVPEELLPAMNAVRPLSNNVVGQMIGPAVGGIIAAASTTWAIGVDCSTFVVSAASLFLMRPTASPRGERASSMVQDIRDGLHYVFQTRWLWTTSVSVSAVNGLVFFPSFVLVPFFLRDDLHASKLTVGFFFAVAGFAGAIGALVASNQKMPRRRIRVMWSYWMVATLSALILGFATNYWEVFLFPVVLSPMVLLGNVIFESMMQTEVPRELLGRASSFDWFVSFGLAPVGLVAAGQLANLMGIRTYFVVMSLVCAIPGVWILVSPRINAIDALRVSAAAVEEPAPGRGP